MEKLNAKTKDLRAVNQAIKQSLNGQEVKVQDAAHLNGLAAGLKHGQVRIAGDAGDYLAVLNAGALITLEADAGNYLADNMTGGKIVVEGNAGYGAGMYCYGGTLLIKGNAGDFTASMNKGATIIVEGSVGDEVGTYMLAGDLIVLGDAGENFANYLIRGSVYIGGECSSLGNNTRVEPLTSEDVEKLKGIFEQHKISAAADKFRKIVAASEKPFYH